MRDPRGRNRNPEWVALASAVDGQIEAGVSEGYEYYEVRGSALKLRLTRNQFGASTAYMELRKKHSGFKFSVLTDRDEGGRFAVKWEERT